MRQRAGPGQAGAGQPGLHQPNPALKSIAARPGVGMIGLGLDQSPNPVQRIDDGLERVGGRVAEHVDGGGEKVQGGEAGPHQGHLPAGFVRRAGGGERRQSRADHGDIGLHGAVGSIAGWRSMASWRSRL